jgi:hypothetical protein
MCCSVNPKIVRVQQGEIFVCLECYWVWLARAKAMVSLSTNNIGDFHAILRMSSLRGLKNMKSLTTASNQISSLSNQS